MNTSNPYAPPRAPVQDVADPSASVEAAGRFIRLVAVIVDGLIIVAFVYFPLIFFSAGAGLIGPDGQVNPAAFVGVGSLIALVGLIVVIWLNIVFVSRNGQSIGKKLLGIKVVRSDGSKATLSRIWWLRNFVNGVISMVPLYGLVDMLVIFGERRQCLHDKIADTIVVKA